jgi:hypothetical protein
MKMLYVKLLLLPKKKAGYNTSNPNSRRLFTGFEYQNNSKSSCCFSKSVLISCVWILAPKQKYFEEFQPTIFLLLLV